MSVSSNMSLTSLSPPTASQPWSPAWCRFTFCKAAGVNPSRATSNSCISSSISPVDSKVTGTDYVFRNCSYSQRLFKICLILPKTLRCRLKKGIVTSSVKSWWQQPYNLLRNEWDLCERAPTYIQHWIWYCPFSHYIAVSKRKRPLATLTWVYDTMCMHCSL